MADIAMPAQPDTNPAESASLAGSGLVQRARQGNRQAFLDLFEAHERRIYCLALRISGDVAVAEKLTGDIFIQAFSNLGAVSDEGSFALTLHRSALQICLRTHRRIGGSPSRASVSGAEMNTVHTAAL